MVENIHTIYENLRDKVSPTIRIKALLAFLVLIFVPLILLTTVTYNIVSNQYEEQITRAADQSFDQAILFLEYKVEALIKASDIVYLNNEIQTILGRDMESTEDDVILQYQDSLYLDNILYSLKNNEDVFRIKLYVKDYLFYAQQNVNYGGLFDFMKSDAYGILENADEKVSWLKPALATADDYVSEVSVISMLRRINNVEEIGQMTGIIEISILEDKVKEIMTKADITQSGVVFIRNSRNEIISASDQDRLEAVGDEVVLSDFNQQLLTDEEVVWHDLLIGSDAYRMRAQQITNTDWQLVALVPVDEILAPGVKIRNRMFVLFVILGIVAFLIAYFLTDGLTRRIRQLSDSMVEVQKGNTDTYVVYKGSDEIGQLYASFNYMIKRLNVYIEQQYEDGKNIKNAELKALQAQINPHFLYNTLDLINWKALDKEAFDIAEVAQALAKFYKLSLNQGKDIVTIEDELSHISQYVKIQNMRFDNRIQYECHMPKDLMGYQIPKIILQPIIENAIMHGILKKRHGVGNIKVTGQMNQSRLEILIEDDGTGIDPNRLTTLLSKVTTKESHGYGIRNIHERLQLLYGESYGLTYESQLGVGTKVKVSLPAIYY